MNRLLLAMSTLPDSINNSSFKFEIGNDVMIDECISQLEPVPSYMIEILEDGLEIIVLASKEAREKVNANVQNNACTFFMRRLLFRCGKNEELHALPEVVEVEKVYDYGQLRFYFIDIDEDRPETGIKKSVEYIKNNRLAENEKFWIDTHGGFRDISLNLNSVVSLLKVYGVYPDEIVGVRFTDNRSISRVVNQRSSFAMFDFVSGMNEFINFGSADSLIEYYGNTTDESIQKLIASMKKISDGTRLCDPIYYVEGLKDLRKIIDKVHSDDQMITVFTDYIREDYGVLLTDRWTALDIIERCCRKKLYQQAMTFAESMMPDLFVKNRILYCDESAGDVIYKIKRDMAKGYASDNNFIFDSLIYEYDYVPKNVNNWSKLSSSEKKKYGNTEQDYVSIKVLDEWNEHILNGFIGVTGTYKDSYLVKVTKNNKEIGNIEVFTDLVDAESKKKAGKLLRLHKAIKNCRNMINHAAHKAHPSISAIETGLDTYIRLARELFESETNHSKKKSHYKTEYLNNKK